MCVRWFPLTRPSFVCLSHGGDSLAQETNQSWSPNSGPATAGELSNQSWTPNPGQASKGEPHSLATVLASEHVQQPQLASSLALPQDHNAQSWSSTGHLLTTRLHLQRRQVPNANHLVTLPLQYLPSGGSHIPNDNAEAQLTQPISRDDDADMPAAPLMHDIATPRRQIGGRCRKWAAACCMCGQQFGRGEARLQQWSNRNSQHAYVHAQCVNGGVAHDHE